MTAPSPVESWAEAVEEAGPVASEVEPPCQGLDATLPASEEEAAPSRARSRIVRFGAAATGLALVGILAVVFLRGPWRTPASSPALLGDPPQAQPNVPDPPLVGIAPVPPPSPPEPVTTGGTLPAQGKAPASDVRSEPPPATATTTVKAKEPGMGTLRIHAAPWGFVWVDQEKYTGDEGQGAWPILKRSLPAGRHLVHTSDSEGKTHDRWVTIVAGKEAQIEITAEQAK